MKLQKLRLPANKLQIALSVKIFDSFMDALNFLRELLCFILLSRLFQMLVAPKVKVRWPKAVLKRGI